MAKKDYAAIAKAKISSPTKGSDRMPRFLVYGRNKKGKTRFCATAPDVLILDPEDGAVEEKKLDPDVWPITEWQDLEDAYGFLKSGGKSPKTEKPYQWVALDGMTRFLSMALNFVNSRDMERDLSRKPEDVDQRTYGRANKMVEGLLHNFHSLRHIGMVITAQERMIEISNMEDMGDDEDATPAGYMYVPDLSKGSRAPLNQVVDVIGRIYVVRGDFTHKKRVRNAEGKVVLRSVETKVERRLWIGPHEMYDTGGRSGFELPDFIKEPTIASLTKVMREGKGKA